MPPGCAITVPVGTVTTAPTANAIPAANTTRTQPPTIDFNMLFSK
jgi:hypothetical protein